MMSSRIYRVNKTINQLIKYLTLLLTKTTIKSKTHYAPQNRRLIHTCLCCNKKLKSILLVLSEIDNYLPFFVQQTSEHPCSATHLALCYQLPHPVAHSAAWRDTGVSGSEDLRREEVGLGMEGRRNGECE